MTDTRRTRSATGTRLRAMGIAAIPPLPLLEPRLRLRSAASVAGRANALHLLYALYLRGADSARWFWSRVRDHGWEAHFSVREATTLAAGEVSGYDIVQYSWRKESCKTLLWLGSVVPDAGLHCDVAECDLADHYAAMPPDKPYADYVADFALRPERVAIEALDLYYCLHWLCKHDLGAIRAARIPIVAGVVRERRHALEWAMLDEDWDRVPLDT